MIDVDTAQTLGLEGPPAIARDVERDPQDVDAIGIVGMDHDREAEIRRKTPRLADAAATHPGCTVHGVADPERRMPTVAVTFAATSPAASPTPTSNSWGASTIR